MATVSLLSVERALELIRDHAPRIGAARHPIGYRLAGRVLAADVVATVDLPPFATSSMDGYAVRAAELGGEPLPIAFRIAAGDRPGVLPMGSAAGIATGAPLPEGADAIVPIEDAEERDGLVAEPTTPGACIRRAAEDVAAGQTLARAGDVLTPALLAAIASAGADTVEVCDRPRIAVLATGSELAAPGLPLEPGQIYESNAISIAAQAVRAGAEVTTAAMVIDDRDATEAAFAAAIADADLVVSSGGVSVGPHDYVKPALDALGVREVFWRIAHKPGKPLWFGVAGDGTPVFGLPGNPVSSLVCFELFVRAALVAMQGVAPRPRPRARLATPVRRLAIRDHAVRCRLVPGAEGMELHAQDAQESHLIVHAAAADAIALVSAGTGHTEAGAIVEYLPL
ncbi:MAG: molybdopterin molybdotransferase [Gaiellales bacterium]|nr:molybdopterin molybdotransferase [Gaiellales bacterium]